MQVKERKKSSFIAAFNNAKQKNMEYILLLIVLTVSVWLTAKLLPGAYIKNFYTAIPVAIILTLFNVFLKPILIFLSIPFTVITFGLFLFVVNGLIVWWVSKLVDSFSIKTFGWAIVFSLLLSVIQSVLETVFS